MFKSIMWAVFLGILAIEVIAMSASISSEQRAVEISARNRAGAALDMLSSVHTQAMMNRKGTAKDAAIETLNGTMVQFSKSSADVALWVVMGAKVQAFQNDLNRRGSSKYYEIEQPRDSIDHETIDDGVTRSRIVAGHLRESRPVIFGRGVATIEKCGGCHAKLMGIQPGEVIGAYSASVNLAPDRALARERIWNDIKTTAVLTAGLMIMIMALVRAITIRPLARLTQATADLAEGKLEIDVRDEKRGDEIGALARSISLFRDTLVNKGVLEARNAYLATHDEMTGLPNRAAFSAALTVELQTAELASERLAVVGIDLNRFKEINDRHGHAAGDALLIALAQRAMRMLDCGEVVARFGGDEFVAFKRFTDAIELDEFVNRLEAAMSQPIRVDQLMFLPGASLGVATFPSDGQDAEQLIANADLAMYRAKVNPASNICHYTAAMDELARKRGALASDLRLALRDRQFEVHYQPQICVESGAVIGFEALLRWHHPQHGLVSPSVFIPLAEQNGEIVKIGDWVLKTACAEAASWDNDLKIAVNVSAVQLSGGDLARRVYEILLETGLPARRLELEVTETAIVADHNQAIGILRMIKALGVSIAMDDFGSGYSSLATLSAFPFDKIKMDRLFLREAETRPETRAIVRAIIAIGSSLGVPVLAEGVETEWQLALLRAEGCVEAQGYLFGFPQATPDATTMVPAIGADKADSPKKRIALVR